LGRRTTSAGTSVAALYWRFPLKVLVLGGDGFCGWPTSLHLSQRGHDVVIVDNFARRRADIELAAPSLTPIAPLETRLAAWREVCDRDIGFRRLNIAEDYDELVELLDTLRPDAVVHFAEQRAAPYSMRSSAHKRYTVNNNLNATNNLLVAIVEAGIDPHVVHLGTMGVYGYGAAAESGKRLPHDQDAGPADVRLLQPQRRDPDHRPPPGHRVGDADARDRARRAPDQPLRLRR
jgi:UDP-sulfoquinovose synthase